MARLVRLNAPGRVSLAGAYALGYGGLAVAQLDGNGPDWFSSLDPLETLFLGTAWPSRFRDSYEFANACNAWLRRLRGTVQWKGIERFVREALEASQQHDLPVDGGELMLLLTGRLEAAGLDQRKLPRGLLPGELLKGARFIFGPPDDIRLPDRPQDAADTIARFWSSVEVGMPHDGTPSDALREGLHMLAAAGLDVRSEPVHLLCALYAALVADGGETLADAGERAAAWALGLSDDSPLVPVADVLLVAVNRDLDPDTVLGHLLGIPAFTQQVRPQDRTWHSSPGHALITLAFELGYQQVQTRDGKATRVGQGAAAALAAQVRSFEAKFGRPPAPGEPLFFDPEASEPAPMPLARINGEMIRMLEAAGICPAWIYAFERTNGLLPRFDGSFVTGEEAAELDAAIEEYTGLHAPSAVVDPAAQIRKLQAMLVAGTMEMAAGDPQYAYGLAARLSAGAPDEADGMLLAQCLQAWRGWLLEELRAGTPVLEEACEYARAWAGADLAAQVRAAADPGAGEEASLTVLLAAAVAAAPRLRQVN